MKIDPASALAAWAVGTTWLVAFHILERFDSQIGEGLTDMIQLASGLLGLAFYLPIRKMFVAWLAKR